MKIRLSLRFYFIFAMLLLGVSMILFFSSLSYKNFKQGLEVALLYQLYDAAQTYDVKKGHPKRVMHLTVAASWEDIPEEVRRYLQEAPSDILEIKKEVVRNHYLSSEPKAVYFATLFEDDKGTKKYVSASIEIKKSLLSYKDFKEKSPPIMDVTICIAMIIGVLFIVFLLLLIKTISRPVEALGAWAQNLTMNNLHQSPPDFKYSELNNLSSLIRDSLFSVKETLEREKEFLDYSSHELRTPISIIQSNVELLKNLDTHSNMEKKVYDRLDRASNTIRDLTETILWVTIDNKKSLPVKTFDLEDKVREIFNELAYLLQGKNVTTDINLSSFEIELPFAGEIVLSNLIRNALQHTDEGCISIKQEQATVIIINENIESDKDIEVNGNDLGFGLGLQLTCKLIEHFSWKYTKKQYQGGYYVEICFN